MRRVTPAKAGLSVGFVVGFWHLIWVSLVAVGLARPFMDFVLHLHFIKLDYDLAPFALGTALSLVAFTFCVGTLFGTIFAVVWNRLTAAQSRFDKFGRSTARAKSKKWHLVG